MKKIIQYISIPLLLCLLAAMIPAANQENMVIIVNEANTVQPMTASQVKLTYLRKINKRWKEINKNIVPVDRKGDPEIRKRFLKEILDLTNDEFTRHFTEREYSNAEPSPIKVSTDAEAIDYVENNVGAIAYVTKSSIVAGAKVKILFGN